MRIITGKFKGRRFDVPRSFKARPTTDFAKENIFNVIQAYIDFEDIECLDLFAGTGSISLEMLSRGAARVTSIELDRDHIAFIRACSEKLGLKADEWSVLRADVLRYVKSCKSTYNFIFADPPYALSELPTLPDLILNNNLLKPNGILVFEHGKKNDFQDHPRFVEHREYGSVNFSIFK